MRLSPRSPPRASPPPSLHAHARVPPPTHSLLCLCLYNHTHTEEEGIEGEEVGDLSEGCLYCRYFQGPLPGHLARRGPRFTPAPLACVPPCDH